MDTPPHDTWPRPRRAPVPRDSPERFFRDGRLSAIPVKRRPLREVLAVLVDAFEEGRPYAEGEVNLVLLRYHDDFCVLRRALIDEGFLARTPTGEEYRRLPHTVNRCRNV